MFRDIAKACLILGLILSIFATAPLAYAEGAYKSSSVREEEGRGEEMIFDLLFLRPIGFAATVIGAAAFVVSLPFTIPMKQVDEAADKLVVKPGKYTFVRKLGHGKK